MSGYAEDIIASAQVMNETANTGKGWYFGYSLGTTEAMVALATRESEMEAYFNSVVLLAPCFFTETEEQSGFFNWKGLGDGVEEQSFI